MTYIPAAIAAVQMGFHIFPVLPNGKTPGRMYPKRSPEEAPWTIKWGDVATNNLEAVVQRWAEDPWANIGVACKPSSLLVVDCDIAKESNLLKGTAFESLHKTKGSYVDGYETFQELVRMMGKSWDEVNDTYRVCTGSMGTHFYYWWPEGVTASQASIVKGVLDIRCNGGTKGGYVLGAGSVTQKGFYVAENNLPVRPAPGWLVEYCTERPRIKQPADQIKQPGSSNYSGLEAAVESAPEGDRNNCLLWAARNMYSDGATEDHALRILGAAAGRNGMPDREATSTIRSAYRVQAQKEGR